MTSFQKLVAVSFCFVVSTTTAFTQLSWQPKEPQLPTRWTHQVSPENSLPEYPRPQLKREKWQNLNGLWDYAITDSAAKTPAQFDNKILVPFPLESALSGVKKTLLPSQILWYKRTINKPGLKNGERLLLHFGAVDYRATLYVNGKEVGKHEGGYTAFSFDITNHIKAGGNELLVKVYDPSDAGIGPRGKQVLRPENIYYTPSSGIWQTVWLETVPVNYITNLKLMPVSDSSLLYVTAEAPAGHEILIRSDDQSAKGKPNSIIRLPIQNMKVWSPANPHLYDLKVYLLKNGKTIDSVSSYFGMRKVEVKKDGDGHDRIFLNNEPYFNLGVLDQGFWPDGLHTAPSDEALRFDIEAIKSMGFNTIRKHIKVEPARWYYHADRLGMLVWQDFVQPNPDLPPGAKEIFEKQGSEMMKQLHNHPSITTWVLFNEKWGRYDQQRLTEWVKKTDPSRLVNGHSGEILYVNEKLRSPSPDAFVSSDIADIHSYPDPMNAPKLEGKAQVLGEFGGIGVFIPGHQWNTGSAWGYITVTPAALKAKYQVMNQHLQLLQKEGLSASIYTQPFDVEGEQNGLMTYDREVVKIPFEELRKIHVSLHANTGKLKNVTAKNADLTEPAQLYADMMNEYMKGKRDRDFLKKLTMSAMQSGDAAGKNRFGADYLAVLEKPFGTEEMTFIQAITKRVSDPGFAYMLEKRNELTGPEQRNMDVSLMNMIYQDVIAPHVPTADAKPDWTQLAETVKSYGNPGEEIYLRAKTIHLYNQQDWPAYAPTASEYISKYGSNMPEHELKSFKDALNNGK